MPPLVPPVLVEDSGVLLVELFALDEEPLLLDPPLSALASLPPLELLLEDFELPTFVSVMVFLLVIPVFATRRFLRVFSSAADIV